jgi:glycerol kinase
MASGDRSILVADEGTTNAKAFAFSEDGRSIAAAHVGVRSTYPAPGLVEQDPAEIWGAQVRALRKVASKVALGGVAGLGIANQRETTLVWDTQTGESLHRAIVWQDKRGVSVIEAMDPDERALVQERTGLIPDSYFSAPKLAWLLDRHPRLRARAERGEVKFGTVDSYLIWRLTGGRVHATDSSNASRTMLMDVRTLEWDEEILKVMHIPAAMLPEIRSSAAHYGEVESKVLGRRVPIAGVAGDQQAALLGHAALGRGEMKSTFGTGTFVLMNTGSSVVRSRNLLSTVAWTVGKRTTYAMEGSILAAGSSIRWLVDGIGLASSVGEVERVAAVAASSGGVFFVPALSGLGAPYWDPHARGLMIGMTHGTTRREILRASMESIAFQTRDVVEEMSRELGRKVKVLRVDGGAAESDFLLQVVADITGMRVERTEFVETTARGAAFLAGIYTGVWRMGDLSSLVGERKTFHPRTTHRERDALYSGWNEAVTRSRGWVRDVSRPRGGSSARQPALRPSNRRTRRTSTAQEGPSRQTT